jgi:hypothetical protein
MNILAVILKVPHITNAMVGVASLPYFSLAFKLGARRMRIPSLSVWVLRRK